MNVTEEAILEAPQYHVSPLGSGPLSATFGARRRASTLPEPFLIDPEIDESGFQQSGCDSVRTAAFNEVA